MSDETLEDIIKERESKKSETEAKEGDLLKAEEKKAHDEKYKSALETGYKVAGLLRGGIAQVWNYVSFGDEKAEEELIHKSASLHADVIVKYDLPDGSGFFVELYRVYKEEIKLGVFYGTIAFTAWKQIKAHQQANENVDTDTGGSNGEESDDITSK